MKKLTLICLMAIFAACNQPVQKQEKANTPATQTPIIYTCSMHPEVAADKPGTCPKCGMDLVEKDK